MFKEKTLLKKIFVFKIFFIGLAYSSLYAQTSIKPVQPESIVARTPSGAIDEKQTIANTYKNAHALQNKIIDILNKLKCYVEENLSKENNLFSTCTIISNPGVKQPDRAAEKVNKEYERDWKRILDIARASIAFPDLETLKQFEPYALKLIEERGLEVAFEKDIFDTPTASGYRDRKYLLRDKQTGYIGELQFHICHIFRVKNPEHDIYEEIRAIAEGKDQSLLTTEEHERIAELRKKSNKIYADAYDSHNLSDACMTCWLKKQGKKKSGAIKRPTYFADENGKIRIVPNGICVNNAYARPSN